MSVINAKHFHDEQAAYDWVEARVWPQGRVCPHCGVVGDSGALKGKSTRIGVYKCYSCRKPFTVKIGTIFEASHIKMHVWLQAMFLLCSSKKGISSHQLSRVLGITLKSAWFLSHRIREAMADKNPGPMGGEGTVVEADETYFGPRQYRRDPKTGEWKGVQGPGGKAKVISLVERGGKVRSLKVEKMSAELVSKIVRENVKPGGTLMTDESGLYKNIGSWAVGHFKRHKSVMHSADEFVRYDADMVAHTNPIEGFFSVFKRGMRGVYQQCGDRHLHRYLAEFDFRYNNRIALGIDDIQRTEQAVLGIIGKRLTYTTSIGRGA